MAKLASSFELLNGDQIEFRNLREVDAKSFLEFRKLVPHESTHTMQYVGMKFPSVEETAKRLADQEAHRVDLALGAFSGPRVVGYLNFSMPHPEHPWVQHVGRFGMMVLKEFWGLGIGRVLLRLQEQHAAEHGIIRIEAMVRTQNDRGLRLYKNNGYQVEGVRRRAARIDGLFHDEYFIAKLLDESTLA